MQAMLGIIHTIRNEDTSCVSHAVNLVVKGHASVLCENDITMLYLLRKWNRVVKTSRIIGCVHIQL